MTFYNQVRSNLTRLALVAATLLTTATAVQAQNNMSDTSGNNMSDTTGNNMSDVTGTDTASDRARRAGLTQSDIDELVDDLETSYVACASSGSDCTTFNNLLNQAQEILQP